MQAALEKPVRELLLGKNLKERIEWLVTITVELQNEALWDLIVRLAVNGNSQQILTNLIALVSNGKNLLTDMQLEFVRSKFYMVLLNSGLEESAINGVLDQFNGCNDNNNCNNLLNNNNSNSSQNNFGYHLDSLWEEVVHIVDSQLVQSKPTKVVRKYSETTLITQLGYRASLPSNNNDEEAEEDKTLFQTKRSKTWQ